MNLTKHLLGEASGEYGVLCIATLQMCIQKECSSSNLFTDDPKMFSR